jgi:nicotinamide-nucleotide amidase
LANVLCSKEIHLFGISLEEVEEQLENFAEEHQDSFELSIQILEINYEIRIKLLAKTEDEESGKKYLKSIAKEIKEIFKEKVYTMKEGENLEQTVVRLLKKREIIVSTAESCTGGLVAARLINIPGASEILKQGFITYSNKAKRKILDVDKSTLKKYGAVSSQTAKEMAMGGAFAANADACIAVTGIAGPDGGTDEKPVGLVYLACYFGDRAEVERHELKGSRKEVREQSVLCALDLLRRTILKGS